MLKEGYNTSREWLLKVVCLTGAIPMFLMASLATISFLLAAFIVVTNGSAGLMLIRVGGYVSSVMQKARDTLRELGKNLMWKK
jgi:hypothetical protein